MELKKYKLGELLSKIENGAVIKQNECPQVANQ